MLFTLSFLKQCMTLFVGLGRITYIIYIIFADLYPVYFFICVLDLLKIVLVIYLQKDKESEIAAKWKLCAITQEPLQKPIVACELGK